ncbi:hypothetical protein GCM10023192_52960 [Amycolatopsis samaneae]
MHRGLVQGHGGIAQRAQDLPQRVLPLPDRPGQQVEHGLTGVVNDDLHDPDAKASGNRRLKPKPDSRRLYKAITGPTVKQLTHQ